MFLQWKKGFYKLETKPICYKTSWSSFGRSFLQSYSQVLQLGNKTFYSYPRTTFISFRAFTIDARANNTTKNSNLKTLKIKGKPSACSTTKIVGIANVSSRAEAVDTIS